jgi:hypothetical protein
VSREQLDQAREYIRAKDYQSARKLLITINHPTATEWLKKLDQVDPFHMSAAVPIATPSQAPQRRSRGVYFLLALALVVIVGLLVLIAYQQTQITAQLARNDPNYRYTELVLTYGDYRQTGTAFYQSNEVLIDNERTVIARTPTATYIGISMSNSTFVPRPTATPGGPTSLANATYVEEIRQQAVHAVAATFTAIAKTKGS